MNRLLHAGLTPFRCTVLISGPATGRTTILKALTCMILYVRGFLLVDMSKMMEWHRDPKNGSPLRDFFVKAKEMQDKGDLVPDLFVINGLLYYLARMQEEMGRPLAHVVLSGFPRTVVQLGVLLEMLPDVRMFYIHCTRAEALRNREERIARDRQNGKEVRADDKDLDTFLHRWDLYKGNPSKNISAVTYPVIDAFKESCRRPNIQFRRTRFAKSLRKKLLILVGFMDLTNAERGSLNAHIKYNRASAVNRLIWDIEHPDEPFPYGAQPTHDGVPHASGFQMPNGMVTA